MNLLSYFKIYNGQSNTCTVHSLKGKIMIKGFTDSLLSKISTLETLTEFEVFDPYSG